MLLSVNNGLTSTNIDFKIMDKEILKISKENYICHHNLFGMHCVCEWEREREGTGQLFLTHGGHSQEGRKRTCAYFTLLGVGVLDLKEVAGF